VRQPIARTGEEAQAEGEELAEERAEEQARAERSVAPPVLRRGALRGRRVTGAARSCQRTRCQPIRPAHGHSRFVITANQPELLEEVALRCAAPPPGEHFATAQRRRTPRDRGAVRTVTVSAALAEYVQAVGGVGAQQVLRLERVVTTPAKTTQLVRSFLTSRGPQTAPRELVRLVREHGHLAHRLHAVRDVTLGEDASQVRTGAAPKVVAALRNALLGLLRQHGWTTSAAALRHFAWSPGAALGLLGLRPT
jgi:predicted transposase YbfD/YdcC